MKTLMMRNNTVRNRRETVKLFFSLMICLFAFSGQLYAQHIQSGPLKNTFANPLSLPDYPLGNWTTRPTPNMDRWIKGYRQDFRELADPSVIYYEGKWIMYPSVSMAYVSEDFINWRHHKITPEKIGDGYAPSVELHNGKFYLIGCFSELYVSCDPLGPFKSLGPILKPNGEAITEEIFDPMLFSDAGCLYLYYHVQGNLVGTILNNDKPVQMDAEVKILAGKRTDQVWERYGEYNEDPRRSFMEGVWMFKHNGKYYLTYTGPGTANGTYALGTYIGNSPLGTFEYQDTNPVLRKPDGVVPGSGHGSIVRGPGNTIWAFTTSVVGNYFVFERRIGLFPVGFDEQGRMCGYPARDIPQYAPGVLQNPEKGNETEWLPVSVRTIATASSSAPGRTPDYAMDDNCRTWWASDVADKSPSLVFDLKTEYEIAGVRIMWAEPGLDQTKGILAGPIRYRLLYQEKKSADKWNVAVDCSANEQDFLIDYRVFETVKARRVKLEILGAPEEVNPGILDMTIFGKTFSYN